MSNTDNISVTILVKNAEDTIRECLEALRPFGEIVIVDNESTDGTAGIIRDFAASHGHVKMLRSPFVGFGPLKRMAVDSASNDWILSIDADEILQESAVKEINSMELDVRTVAALARMNYYDGVWVKGCGWYPDYVWRLFNRCHTGFNDNMVHEAVEVRPDSRKVWLKKALKHYAATDISTMLAKMNRYTSYSAREKWENGRRVTLPGALLRGWHTFNIDYLFRGGIRYGYRGFFIALSNASGTFYRYLKLYELQKRNARK
ncbi:MAG: glycosyltransferase family 2 protein [Bacteroidales bacterium]|nr:glycosyltransferase family 2 protein [Bacteroidales bacterium]